MRKYIVGRIISMIISLFVIITITFFMLHIIPGGPFTRDKALPDAVLKAMESRYQLNDPVYIQFINYLKQIINLDLGPSFQKVGYSVNDLILAKFPTSAKVGGITVVFALLMGIPLGVVSALKYNKWQDRIIKFFSIMANTIPNFVLGTLIIFFLGVKFDLIPTFGLKGWKYYIGPVLTLGAFSTGFIAMLVRSSMLEVLEKDYIQMARAKGLSELKIISKHALKNALIPVIHYTGPLIATLLTGSFVTEKIFAISGIGNMFVESVGNRDYTVVIGATIIYAVLLLSMTFLSDILCSIIDRRIKLD